MNKGHKIETFFILFVVVLKSGFTCPFVPKKGLFQCLQPENLAIGTVLCTINIFGDTFYVREFGEYRQRMKDRWEQ